MDSIDWEEQDNHFITMYVYLNAVDKNMSPLNIIKKVTYLVIHLFHII